MKSFRLLIVSLLLLSSPIVFGQDAMQYGLKHLKVLAEDGKARVLKYTPHKGDKTPMHSHPFTVVYVIKGGGIRITLPDGTSKDSELKTGDSLLRPPVTHADEALDDLEVVLVEIKN
jgi:quercetin dioxygenase-like cupin family protein